MTTATVTRRLQAEGLPVELVRGDGYHYFIFDDGSAYETESVMVPRFRSWSVDRWVEEGRAFAAKARKLADDRAEALIGNPYVPTVDARMDRYRAAYKALHGATVAVVWTGEKVRVHTPGEAPAYDAFFPAEELDEISARMEAKVRQPVRVDQGENLMDIFAEVEAAAIAEGQAEKARDDAAFAALTDEEKAARTEAFETRWAAGDVEETDEEPDDDDDDGESAK